MPRLLAAAIMLANAVLTYMLVRDKDAFDAMSITAVVCSGLLGILAVLLAVRPLGLVAIVARGVAFALIGMVMTVIAAGTFISWAVSGSWDPSTSTAGVIESTILIGLQLLLLRSLPLDAQRSPRGAVLTGAAAVVTVVVFVSTSYASRVATTYFRLFMFAPGLLDNAPLTEAVARVQACAVSYAQRGGGYPDSLSVLGPGVGRPGCLDQALASGRAADGKVTVVYQLRRPDRDRDISRFQVIARGGRDFDGGERIAVGDESGVIRSGSGEGDVQSMPVVHGGLHIVRTVRACAEAHREAAGSDAYPRRYPALVANPSGGGERVLRWLGCFWGGQAMFTSFDSTNRQRSVGHYRVAGDTLTSADYLLDIRPRRYGVDGVRSLHTTAHGPVHWTVENRAAHDRDPVVVTCAYTIGEGTCAPAPGTGRRARIELEMPDSVGVGYAFLVRVRDRRTPSAQTYPYQHHMSCSVRQFDMEPTPPTLYSVADTATCRGTPDAESSEFRYVNVRVWTRDHSTTESYVERRVPVIHADSIERAFRQRSP